MKEKAIISASRKRSLAASAAASMLSLPWMCAGVRLGDYEFHVHAGQIWKNTNRAVRQLGRCRMG
jgi:hypothetical protein